MTAPDRAPAPTPGAGIGFEELRLLLSSELDLDLAGAGPDDLLVDLGWDSLTLVELAALGERWGVALPDELVGSLRTLGDVHHNLDAHLRHRDPVRRPPPGELATSSVQLVPVHRGHDELLWHLHTQGRHLVDYRMRGMVASPERFHQLLWDGVLAQFLVATHEGQAIGLVSALRPDFRNRHAHVAVVVDQAWQGSGLALAGLARFTSYLFTQFDLRKVYAEVMERNLPSFGSGVGRWYVVEGRLTEHEYIDGGYEDMVVLAADRARWRLAHERFFGEPPPF